MVILKLLLASFIVGGMGSLFVWRKKRFAIFAPVYFSMLGTGLGFWIYAFIWFSTTEYFDSVFNGPLEKLWAEITPHHVIQCGYFVLIMFTLGLLSGIGFVAIHLKSTILIKGN